MSIDVQHEKALELLIHASQVFVSGCLSSLPHALVASLDNVAALQLPEYFFSFYDFPYEMKSGQIKQRSYWSQNQKYFLYGLIYEDFEVFKVGQVRKFMLAESVPETHPISGEPYHAVKIVSEVPMLYYIDQVESDIVEFFSPSGTPSSQLSRQELAQMANKSVVHGQLVISKSCIVQDVLVKGDLHVSGHIYGRLVTGGERKDYAEWYPSLDGALYSPGTVVQVRQDGQAQKISTDTSHVNCGAILIVSTSPSVAAGMPLTKEAGAVCAFLGQVPVKVHGPVVNGEYLYPSGKNDGFAVSSSTHSQNLKDRGSKLNSNLREMRPIATALEDCASGEHTILSLIRWEHNSRGQQLTLEHQKEVVSLNLFWLTILILGIDYALSWSFYLNRSWLSVDMTLAIISMHNFISESGDFRKNKVSLPIVTFTLVRICGLVLTMKNFIDLLTIPDMRIVNNQSTLSFNEDNCAEETLPLRNMLFLVQNLYVAIVNLSSSLLFFLVLVKFLCAFQRQISEQERARSQMGNLLLAGGNFFENTFANSVRNLRANNNLAK